MRVDTLSTRKKAPVGGRKPVGCPATFVGDAASGPISRNCKVPILPSYVPQARTGDSFVQFAFFSIQVIFQVCIEILFWGIGFDEMGTLLFVFVFVCVFCNWCLFVASVFAAGAGASCRVCTGLTRWPTVTLFWFFTMTLSVLFCNILLHFQPQWWLLRSEPHGVSLS